MPETLHTLHGVKVLACSPDGKKLRTDRDAAELIGEAYEHEARWIVIPTERFEDAFFQLHTRIAGEIIGKFAVYKMRVAIVGDISCYTEESSSLRAFVYESNRGNQVWFLPSMEDFESRLEAQRATA
ncbi:MAG TPA: DUF4180 domain-containing protein [Candidatus Acidoferrales bacterium]|jgi:hypothetical protein|nr:DUF4180 domain-containing protein [Candidatus Acidoferrales bacterium]